MPSLAIRPSTVQHAFLPMHARAPKRSGEMPPDLYAALQLFFAIAQKEIPTLPRVPSVEGFLLASCAIESNSDMNATLEAILGRRYSYTFLTNLGVVIGALLIYNTFPYSLHGLPVVMDDVLGRISAGYRWYIRFAFSSAGLKAAPLIPQLEDWLVQSAIPYIEKGKPAGTMLGALESIRTLLATKDYKKAIIRPIMHAIAATGKAIQD